MHLPRLLLTTCLLSLPTSATVTFILTPDPLIFGLPGATLGWGFSLTNDTNYIEITSAQFCQNPVSFPACSVSTLGVFTDFISGFNNIIVGPNGGTLPSTVSQAFNLAGSTGVGSFTIDPLVPLNSFNLGQIVLTYNVFDADPNNFAANLLSVDQIVSAETEIFATDPEPGTFFVGFAVLALALVRSRRA